jgi:ABC-type multidrug transport system ATPase subunit
LFVLCVFSSGKTTLLNILAGYGDGGVTTGSMFLNGEVMTGARMRELSAYVHQQDVILPSQTVREAVTMAAFLRLPRTVPDQVKLNRVEEVLRWLSLVKVADNQIGSPEKKGISGGERRRTSIASELVRNPGVMFLDEPTSQRQWKPAVLSVVSLCCF